MARGKTVPLADGNDPFRLYVGLENDRHLVGALSLLTLLSVSQETVAGGPADASSFQAVGSSLLAARDWTHGFVAFLPFLVGALLYYYLLFWS